MAVVSHQFRAIAGQRGAMRLAQVPHRHVATRTEREVLPVAAHAGQASQPDVFPDLTRPKGGYAQPRSPCVIMSDGPYQHKSYRLPIYQLELFSRQRVLSVAVIRAWLKKRNTAKAFLPDDVLEIFSLYQDFGVSAMSFSQDLQVPAHVTVPRVRPVFKHILEENLAKFRTTILDLVPSQTPHRLELCRTLDKKFDILTITIKSMSYYPDLLLTSLKDDSLLVLNHIYAKPPTSTIHASYVSEMVIRYHILKVQLLAREVNIDAELLTTMPGVGGCVMAFNMKRRASADELNPPPEVSHATACSMCRYHGTKPVKDGAVPEDWYKVSNQHRLYQYKMAEEDRESCELCDVKLTYSHPVYTGKLRPGNFNAGALQQLHQIDLSGNHEYFELYADVLASEIDVPFGPMKPFFGSKGFRADPQTMIEPLMSLGFRVSPSTMDDRHLKTNASFQEYFQAVRKVAEFEDLLDEKRSPMLRNCDKLPPLEATISFVQMNPAVHRLHFMRTRMFHSSIPDKSKGNRR